MSLISIIPYAGDALGKTAKGARLAKKINELRQKISAAILALQKAKEAVSARHRTMAAIRAKRAAEQAKKIADAKKCKTCNQPGGNRFGTRSPKEGIKGSWKGERGNSDWHPNPDTEKGKKVLKATNGEPIEYKNGHPVFSPFAEDKVDINMKGNYTTDFTDARDEMRKKLNDPTWPGNEKSAPEGLTWHHSENGTTMELIPTDINAVTHTGGNSLLKDLKKDPNY